MSDVLGATLLVGLTVIMATALGTVIFNVSKPINPVGAEVTATIDPGTAGWGSGDEKVLLAHLGGEAVDAAATTVKITIGSTTTTLAGATALGDAFANGKLTIGETWTYRTNIPSNGKVSVRVVEALTAGGSQLLAFMSATTDCSGDGLPPIVNQWVQTPADVTTSVLGTISVKAYVADDCQAVRDTPAPSLWYRINPGSGAPAFTNLSFMSAAGAHNWTATIPAQSWGLLGSQYLEYYITPIRDVGGNSGTSATQADLIDDLTTLTYANSNYTVVGTLQNFTYSTAAGDGKSATLTEKSQVGPPLSNSGNRYGLTTAVTSSAGFSNPARVVGSDDSRATFHTAGTEWVEVGGFTAPPNALTITSVAMGVEATKSSSGGNDPQLSLQYKVGSNYGSSASKYTATVTAVTPADGLYTSDITSRRAWTIGDLNSLALRINATSIGNRDAWVDSIFFTVGYTTAGPNVYNMTIEYRFPSLPAANSRELQVSYQINGENFRIQILSGGVWAAVTPDLTQSLPTTWTHTLTSGELAAGPRVRFVDTDATDIVSSQLLLDYVRIFSS